MSKNGVLFGSPSTILEPKIAVVFGVVGAITAQDILRGSELESEYSVEAGVTNPLRHQSEDF